MQARYSALFTLVLVVFASVPAEAQWKAGTARARITPERPVFMAGYDARDKPFEGFEADLYAKALVLEDADGRRAVLITADLIGFSAPVAEEISTAIRKKAGFERKQILLNASHNHSGPALSLDPKPRGKMTADGIWRGGWAESFNSTVVPQPHPKVKSQKWKVKSRMCEFTHTFHF